MSENLTLIWIGTALAVIIGGLVWYLRGRSGSEVSAAAPPEAPRLSDAPAEDRPPAPPPAPPVSEPEPGPAPSESNVIQSELDAVEVIEAVEMESKPAASPGRKKAATRKKVATARKTGKTASTRKPRATHKK